MCAIKGCGKNFRTKLALEQHFLETIKCLKCEKKFHNIDDLADHQALDHEEKVCHCGLTFIEEKHLMEHKLTCQHVPIADDEEDDEVDEEMGEEEEEEQVDEEYFDWIPIF